MATFADGKIAPYLGPTERKAADDLTVEVKQDGRGA